MASADARVEELKGIGATSMVKKMIDRINSSGCSSEEEDTASQGAKPKGRKKRNDRMELQEKGEVEERQERPSIMVTKTKKAVTEVAKLLTLIRESSGREKGGKVAFLKEDQLAVRNATFEIQSEVQKLMLLILESGEIARQAEEGRKKADEEVKRAVQAAKVSASSLITAREELGKRQTVVLGLDNREGNQQAGSNAAERALVWQGARPRTGIWAAAQAGSKNRTTVQRAAGERGQPGNGRATGVRQGARGEEPQAVAGGWIKVASRAEKMKRTTPEVQETVVKMPGKSGKEIKAVLSAKLRMEDIGGPLERVLVKSDQSVVLVSTSREQRGKLEAHMKEVCGEMEVREGTKLRPTVTITLGEDMRAEEVVEEVWGKNEWVREGRTLESFQRDFKFLARRTCRRDRKKVNITFSVEPKMQRAMVEKGKVVVGLTRCFVEEVVAVTRCFQCNGYGHKARECKGQQTCMKCGEAGHKGGDCRAAEKKCSNCNKAGLRADHHVLDSSCPIYRKRLEAKVSRTTRC